MSLLGEYKQYQLDTEGISTLDKVIAFRVISWIGSWGSLYRGWESYKPQDQEVILQDLLKRIRELPAITLWTDVRVIK